MTKEKIDRFDLLLDDLNAGKEMSADDICDGDFVSMLATLREVQRLYPADEPAPEFPRVLARRLARELRSRDRLSDLESSIVPLTTPANGHRDATALPTEREPVGRGDQRWKQSWLRHGIELVAGALLLVVVASLLIALLGPRSDDAEQTAVGSQPTAQTADQSASGMTPSSEWATLISNEHGFTIDFPADWQADPDALFAGAPDQTAALTISLFKPQESINGMEEMEEWVRQTAGPGTVTMRQSRDLGGVSNVVFLFDTTQTSSDPFISLNLYAQPADWLYEVRCYSMSRDAFNRWQSTCAAIIDSFRFIPGESARATATTPSASRLEGQLLTLDAAKQRIRDFIGDPTAVLDGDLLDEAQAQPGRGISGPLTDWKRFEITRQVEGVRYADSFTVDADTGEVVHANFVSHTTLGRMAHPISESRAKEIATGFAQTHFAGFETLTLAEEHTLSRAPGADGEDRLYTAQWQPEAGGSATFVRVSVDLETGEVFSYTVNRDS